MAEFTWTPTAGFVSDSNPKIYVAKFGDGYSQRTPAGINNIERTWNLQFQYSSLAKAASIEAFLIAKQGTQSFTWLPPGETTEVRVICSKWSKTYDSSITRSISATFERVYE